MARSGDSSESLGSWTGRIAITGVGLVTPVGLTAPATAAALRAGISRFADLPEFFVIGSDGSREPAIGARVPSVADGFHGEDRIARLARLAADEALADAGLAPAPAGVTLTGFLGTAAQPRAGREIDHGERLVEGFGRMLDASGWDPEVEVLAAGRAAALRGLREAAAELAAGECDVALVGGADSWIDPLCLGYLDREGRLRTGTRPSGVLPGEGAGFLVLERPDDATARGARIHATIAAAAGADDPTSPEDPLLANVLTSVVREVAKAIDVPAPLVVSDLNGERRRAYEWMFVLTRAAFRYEGELPHWYPASSTGDSGAAIGAIAAGWAALALDAGVAPRPQALVWGASDEGAREALLMQANGR